MTKRDLAEKLLQRCAGLKLRDAEIVVNSVFESMTAALAKGERIEIRGFGSFQIKNRPAREGRNPRSGKKVLVESKRIPFFKVGKELKKRIDK